MHHQSRGRVLYSAKSPLTRSTAHSAQLPVLDGVLKRVKLRPFLGFAEAGTQLSHDVTGKASEGEPLGPRDSSAKKPGTVSGHSRCRNSRGASNVGGLTAIKGYITRHVKPFTAQLTYNDRHKRACQANKWQVRLEVVGAVMRWTRRYQPHLPCLSPDQQSGLFLIR
jgi:hypothetical protein